MNIKTFIILLSILGIIASAILVVKLLTKEEVSEEVENPGIALPSGDDLIPGDTTKISLQKAGGGTLVVNNFLRSTSTVADPYNEGYYFLGNHFASEGEVESNPPFVITYIKETNFFNISLLTEPMAETRKQAESYLREQLGITQEDMCDIQYSVSVPYTTNQYVSGYSLGFSFCPGAATL